MTMSWTSYRAWCFRQAHVRKLGHLMSDMSGKRIVLIIVVIVFAFSLIDAATLLRSQYNPMPQVGLDTLHRLASDPSVSNGTFTDFLTAYDGSGDLLYLAVCSTGAMTGCFRYVGAAAV